VCVCMASVGRMEIEFHHDIYDGNNRSFSFRLFFIFLRPPALRFSHHRLRCFLAFDVGEKKEEEENKQTYQY
jgi:hypothetical protein